MLGFFSCPGRPKVHWKCAGCLGPDLQLLKVAAALYASKDQIYSSQESSIRIKDAVPA